MLPRHPPSRAAEVRTYVIAAALGLFAAAVVVAAKDAFEASVFGLRLWLDAVLPALMPFFALSEILAAFGVIHFIGVLLEPLMRPLFNIPGAGAFAVAMGLVSGYPLGAIITARLVRNRLLNPVEGARLVSLANTADPLFMAGVVAAGFFQIPELGGVLSAAHYLAVVAVGMAGAWWRRDAPRTDPIEAGSREPLLARAAIAMRKARQSDHRPFGEVFGDAVKSAMASMLLVGGTIIMFSVLLRVLTRIGLVPLLASGLARLLAPLGLDAGAGDVLVRALVEITNGAQASAAMQGSLVHRAALASFAIGWSGLSVHAQVAAVLQGTEIRLQPYLLARLIHGVLAAALTVVLLLIPGVGPAPASGHAPPPALAGWSAAPGILTWRLRTAALLLGLMAVGAVGARVLRWAAGAMMWPRSLGRP